MSFLDNLENNLKALEGRDEGGGDNRARRDADRNEAKAAAPWAEKLKNSAWTKNLMGQATRAGFQRRLKVNLIWIGTTLRLDARGQRLELRPMAEGVNAVVLQGGEAVHQEMLDLEADSAPLLSAWMRRVDEEIASTVAVDVEEVES